MPLKDNYWMDVPEDNIPTIVGVIGLSVISAQTTNELIRQGWYSSPAIARLYEKTSAGVWIARTNSSGQETEANSLNIRYLARAICPPLVSSSRTIIEFEGGTTTALRTKQVALNTDGAGVCAATVLLTAAAGYYPVVRVKRIISSVADGVTELNFTVSAGALLGPAQRVIALVAGVMLELGDMLLYDLTAATTISVAIANGPLNSTVWMEIEYRSEL